MKAKKLLALVGMGKKKKSLDFIITLTQSVICLYN